MYFYCLLQVKKVKKVFSTITDIIEGGCLLLSTVTIGRDTYTTGLSNPVLQSLIILLIFVLLGIAACVTALILAAY
jgi:hypothetical protein